MNTTDLEFEPPEGLRRITAREFQEMSDRGVFDGDEHLELLDGIIYSTMAEGHPHRKTCNFFTRLLTTRFPEPYIIQASISLHLGRHDVPEPDFVVYEAEGDAYTSFVDVRKVILIVEISDSSLRKDRILKTRRYALAGVAEYWVVNVNGPEIDVYREPRGQGYANFRRYEGDERIVPSVIPGGALSPRDVVRL